MTIFNTPDMNISGHWGTYYSLGVLLASIFSIIVGSFVLAKGYKERLKICWFVFTLSFVSWSFFIYLWSVSKDYASALIYNRIANYSAIFLSILVVVFTEEFIKKKNRIITKISAITGLTIFILGILSLRSFIPSLSPKTFFKFYPDSGIIYWFFTVFFVLTWNYALVILFKHLFVATGVAQKQTALIAGGLAISVVGGATNFFPVFNINIFPFGSSFTLVYIICASFAIVRYRAFEIDTVIHKTILWLLTIAMLIMPVAIIHNLVKAWMANLPALWIIVIDSIALTVFLAYYQKLKPVIDHLFRRRKYDYYVVLAEIGQKIGSELDINSVIARLFKELKEILYIRNGLVLVRQPGQLDYMQAGVLSYENLADADKPSGVTLGDNNTLSQWINQHQKALEREQVEADPQFESVRQETLGFMSRNQLEVLIPVSIDNKVNALLGIGKKENLQLYTSKDIELLEIMGRQIGITIDNALHHEDIVEKERMAEEMKLGREIQMALLPQTLPIIRGLNVQGLMQPAKEIGGDYYDFITLPGTDKLSVVIGDVSGKGVAAGLLMAMAKTAIQTLSQEEHSPRQILIKTNQILSQHIGGHKFMTLLYFMWQADTRTFTYSSAGHEHILICRVNRGPVVVGGATHSAVEAILSGGFMLGMMPNIETYLEDKEIKLDPGDKILLYTDGVTEAQNRNEERYGLDRLISSFQKHSSKPAAELMRVIKDEVYSFIGTHPQYDDITLVVLEAQ
ncbi:MAG: SpoIIE family protein phosphatase [Candidatus Omnitrophota bacterium]|jgi:serine phosphatase RsbU (regulator of sigma subunit)